MDATKTTEAIDAVRGAINSAYQEGYAAGRADAVKAIMQAASSDMGMGNAKERSHSESSAKEATKDGRAPRGAVRIAVANFLLSRADIGAPTGEIVNSIHLFSNGVEISGISASNELHRQKGKLYSHDAKGIWRLMPEYAAKLRGDEKAVDDVSGENPPTALFNQPSAQGREAGPGGGTRD